MNKEKGIIILFVFLLIGLSFFFINQQNSGPKSSSDFMDITMKEIKKVLKNDESSVTYVLYGQEICGACRDLKATLKEMNLAKDVFYIDSMESNNRKFLNSYGYDVTPTLLEIKNNNISFYVGNKTEEELSEIFKIDNGVSTLK